MSDEYQVKVIPLHDDPNGLTASPRAPWAEVSNHDLGEAMTEAGEIAEARMPKTAKLRPCALDVRVVVP